MHTDLSAVPAQPLPTRITECSPGPPCAGEHNPRVPGAEGEVRSFILISAARNSFPGSKPTELQD